MTQPKSKSSSSSSSSKSKSKKITTPATSKKVKAVAAKPVAVELAPAPVKTNLLKTTMPVKTTTQPVLATPAVEKAPTRLVSRAEFTDLVRKEAYRRYTARRAFKQGSPFQDWVNAEAAVSGKLAAEGARLS